MFSQSSRMIQLDIEPRKPKILLSFHILDQYEHTTYDGVLLLGVARVEQSEQWNEVKKHLMGWIKSLDLRTTERVELVIDWEVPPNQEIIELAVPSDRFTVDICSLLEIPLFALINKTIKLTGIKIDIK